MRTLGEYDDGRNLNNHCRLHLRMEEGIKIVKIFFFYLITTGKSSQVLKKYLIFESINCKKHEINCEKKFYAMRDNDEFSSGCNSFDNFYFK